MAYRVEIIRNETGEKRLAERSDEWDDLALYMWTDGNFGCDCNRAMFFADAGGEEDCDIGCGETRYTVTRAILPNGSEVEIDEVHAATL
jgi:hypothetical protein